MEHDNVYERVLARLGAGAQLPELAPPRASAAVVPWRRAGSGIEVFWVRRAAGMAFMGGFHAFPGGGVSRRDAELELAGRAAGEDAGPADAALPAFVTRGDGELGAAAPPAVQACALRELFEETGLLLVAGSEVDEAWRREARRRLLTRAARMFELVAELGARLDASQLVYAGRWITPPLGPLRFDNRFFLLEWPPERQPQPAIAAGGEHDAGEWVEPGEALERWRRGEVITAPPILHLLAVLAEEGPEKGLARLRAPVEANLGPFRRIEFRPGVLLFPLATPTLPPSTHTNGYLLGFGDGVLVDPGSPFEDELAGLEAALEAAASCGRRTTAIWLTHHHPDHIGGVERLRRALGVPVLAHPATAERLRPLGIEVDGELVDGERVELPGDPPMTLRVLHTPGHAPGHLAFLDESGGSLVCGDIVAGLGMIVIDPPEGDMDEYLRSLERLRDLKPRTLFPAHGPPNARAAARLGEVLEHRLWRESRVLAAWREGKREPAEMLPSVYDDVPKIAWPLAERQILAHLERLERAGKLGD